MNTLVRAVGGHQFIHRISFSSIEITHVWVALISIALFISAFAIVYVKDINRRLYMKVQTLESQNELATESWSKLLLEQSTLITQSRIEKIAKTRIQMVLPESKHIQLVALHELKVDNG